MLREQRYPSPQTLGMAGRAVNGLPPIPADDERRLAELESLGEQLASRLLTVEELVKRPLPEPLIAEVLVKGTIAVLYGKAGSAKSFTALDWSCCLALGLPWQGREVRGGPVLYIAAEGSAGLGKRLQAWKQRARVSEVPGLAILDDALDLRDKTRLRALAYAARHLRAVLVVLDTLARSIPGADENSARDMGQLVDAADYIRKVSGAAVLLVHHTNKEGDLRGSTALPGGIEGQIRQRRTEDGVVKITSEKQKDDADFAPILTRLEEVRVEMPDGSVTTSCVLVAPSGGLVAPNVSTDAKRVALTVLAGSFGATGAASSKWREVCEEADGPKSGHFYRTVTALLTERLVENTGTDKRPHYKPTVAGLAWLDGSSSHHSQSTPTDSSVTPTLPPP